MSSQLSRPVDYLGRDFQEIRANLIRHAKSYFPNTYNDFNETDPGMMFIEMASYVGDVLSFYTDVQLKESLLLTAEEQKNIYDLANVFGYKIQNAYSATTDLDVFQLVPAKGSGISTTPNFDYALILDAGMEIQSNQNSNVIFRTTDIVDFTFSSSLSPMEVKVYSVDSTTGAPTYYLLKKTVKVKSGKLNTSTFAFGDAKQYDKLTLGSDNIIEIQSVQDSQGDTWYEVPFIAQDTVYIDVRNIEENTGTSLSQYRSDAPYVLELKKVPKRFITRVTGDDGVELQFGSGVSSDADEELIPNPKNVGSNLYNSNADINKQIDPSNFLYARTYGLAPSNTTLTVKYLTGNGPSDNVKSGELTDIIGVTYLEQLTTGLNQTVLSNAKASVAVNNPRPASGGRLKPTLAEIKNNTMANFATQLRMVTKNDFIARVFAMPGKYGAIEKAAVVQDTQISPRSGDRVDNPLAVNLHILGSDANGNLTTLNDAVKLNLKRYLSQYRLLTDAINILNAFVINIGIDFDIIVLPNYNANEVILRCVNKLKQMFAIDKWNINEPIVISKVYVELDKVEGVQTVSQVTFKNLSGGDYSRWQYDLRTATRDGIIYPSLDPSIFEIKYPNKDIKGRSIALSI